MCVIKKIVTRPQRTAADRSHSLLSLSNLLKFEGKSLELIIVEENIGTEHEALGKHDFKPQPVRPGMWLKSDKHSRIVFYDDLK